MRSGLAVATGRSLAALSRVTGRGGATSLPGLIGLKIDPRLIRCRSRGLAGSIVVTGTNGKTTTSRLISDLLHATGKPVVSNQSGSNLLRGLASSLILAKPAPGSWGLFEVDEATMPDACAELQPTIVIVTNLFRDQLDRYGELERTAEYLRQGLAQLPTTSTVILNADDPLVASLGRGLKQQVLYYGLEDQQIGRKSLPHAADSVTDPSNGKLLDYDRVYVGHLGHYRSQSGRLNRPTPQVAATDIKLDALTGSSLKLKVGRENWSLEFGLPGLYNVYNAVAAATVGRVLGLKRELITKAISATTAAFGRVELIPVGDKHLFLGLIKNPTGTNEVIHTLALDGRPKHLLIAINDNFADGRDVSWLWDADFEELLPQAKSITVSGTRAADMAVRLKYAGYSPADIVVESSPDRAVELALSKAGSGETVFVLPTYTAMLELRHYLTRQGLVPHYLRT